MTRKPGRPRDGDSPRVPWHDVDRLLVFGETVADDAKGPGSIRYPSFREIGERFGVSKSLIGKYAAKHNCLKRREENRAREQIQYEQRVVKKRAEARALSTDDAVRIIDDYLHRFEEALEEGRVRFDNAGDFNTMLRLKEFVQGRADSRQEIQGMLTLEEIQARHANARRTRCARPWSVRCGGRRRWRRAQHQGRRQRAWQRGGGALMARLLDVSGGIRSRSRYTLALLVDSNHERYLDHRRAPRAHGNRSTRTLQAVGSNARRGRAAGALQQGKGLASDVSAGLLQTPSGGGAD